MKFLRHYILILLTALVLPLTSCSKEDEPVIPIPEQPEHTLICYFTGYQLGSFFYQNIDMIKAAIRTLSLEDDLLQHKVNVVYLFQEYNQDIITLYELEFADGICDSKNLHTYNLPERLDSSTVTYLLNEAISHAPAKSYGLVLGGHSRGWIPIDTDAISTQAHTKQSLQTITDHQMWVRDETALITRFFGDPPKSSNTHFSCIEIDDLAKGIEDTGIKFEYTIYDACFMANIESLYPLRNTTKYAIGSVSEIMGAGFPYTDVIPCLLGYEGKSFDLDGVCRAFSTYYDEQYGYSGSVSLINMQELEALAASFKELRISGLTEDITANAFQRYDSLSEPLFIDMGDYVKLAAADEDDKAAFMAQLEKSIPHKYTLSSFYSAWGSAGKYYIDKNSYHGLTTSYPSAAYREAYYQTEWYKATTPNAQ